MVANYEAMSYVSLSGIDFRFFKFDFVGPAITITDGHSVEDTFMVSQFGLNFQQFQVTVLDVVGATDQILMLLQQVGMVRFDRHAVVRILHLIITSISASYQLQREERMKQKRMECKEMTVMRTASASEADHSFLFIA